MTKKPNRQSPEFAAALATAHRLFYPRFRFIHTRREAEQDAYYWFMKGIESARLDALKILEDKLGRGNAPIEAGREWERETMASDNEFQSTWTSRVLWKLARFFYWLDRKWWPPSAAGSWLVDWMEVRGLCCEKHAAMASGNRRLVQRGE